MKLLIMLLLFPISLLWYNAEDDLEVSWKFAGVTCGLIILILVVLSVIVRIVH